MESHFVHYKGSKLHYIKAGKGKHPLVFFHGFGQDHTIYVPILQSLSADYEIYVFDLYFHGKSEWAGDEKPLEKDEWKATFRLFLDYYPIDSFSLVGFSLGAKFALATLEAFPHRVKQLFLIAPDGIRTSFWYSMATYPWLLRSFFKGMINNYERFARVTETLNKLKLVDKGLVRFADYQMGTEEKRKRVYYSWVVFRHLQFNIRKLAEMINANGIATTVIVGEYDKVIVPDNMKDFVRRLKNVRFEILPSGHTGLIYQSLSFIQKGK